MEYQEVLYIVKNIEAVFRLYFYICLLVIAHRFAFGKWWCWLEAEWGRWFDKRWGQWLDEASKKDK